MDILDLQNMCIFLWYQFCVQRVVSPDLNVGCMRVAVLHRNIPFKMAISDCGWIRMSIGNWKRTCFWVEKTNASRRWISRNCLPFRAVFTLRKVKNYNWISVFANRKELDTVYESTSGYCFCQLYIIYVSLLINGVVFLPDVFSL